MQQKESVAQTVLAHMLHDGLIALPSSHSEWSQLGVPQKPWLHWPEQHWLGPLQFEPSGWQAFWQAPFWQEPEQQSSGTLQPAPFG